jgi:hypothetical protein
VSEHFTQDLENIVPDNLPPLPVGTLAELEAQGLSPAVVPCCHKKVMAGNDVQVLGCPYRTNGMCKLAIRDQAGPQFFGVEYLKGKTHGGGMVRGVRDCFFIARNKEQIEDNGGTLRIVATEGEKFKMVVAGPQTGYKDKIEEVEVPKFPRPGDNPDLVKEQLKAEIREDEKRKKIESQEQFNIGANLGNPVHKEKPSKPKP